MPVMRTPQRKISLSAQLVDNLRSHIASGGWAVGSRLPSEHDLVSQLGVSRTTLREALGALTHLGLLEARAGDGTYVRAASELDAVMVRRASVAPRNDVLELRAILEEYGAGLAAARRTAEDVVQLRLLLSEADSATESGSIEAMIRVDAKFHQAVVRAGANLLLTEVYDHLGHAISESLGGLSLDAGTVVEHSRLHRALVDAIEVSDELGAREVAARIVAINASEPSTRTDAAE